MAQKENHNIFNEYLIALLASLIAVAAATIPDFDPAKAVVASALSAVLPLAIRAAKNWVA